MEKYTGPVITIVGPTGSGKTGLSIEIAKELTGERSASLADALLTRRTSSTSRSATPASSHSISPESSLEFGGEIISADSRAIYKGMDIGTAKPSLEEQSGVIHYGLDLIDPGERFTVADFKEYAEQKICSIREKGKVPIICGGTGLYVDALLYNYQFGIEQKNCSKQQGEQASFAEKYPDRVEMSTDYIVFGIKWSKDELKERLKTRIDKMFCPELYEETKKLVKKYGFGSQAMKSNIYEYVWGYLNGEYSLEKAKELAFYRDVHLAKRQMTWFKRNPEIKWYALSEIKPKILAEIGKFV